MLVGHNPSLAEFLCRLSEGREKPSCRRAFDHVPTAAAAVPELDLADWSGIASEMARFVDFAVPRVLMDA